MAANRFVITPPSEITCFNAGNKKTIVQVHAPATMSINVLGWSISFDGQSVTAEPVEVEIVKQTDDGSMVTSVPIKIGLYDETIQSAGFYDAVTEPTTTDLIEAYEVHPQSGFDVRYSDSEVISLGFDERLAIRVKAAAAVNCRAKLICEE